MNSKKILIFAGPNGAGKTTFARQFLPNEAECRVFINADLIAAGNFENIYRFEVDFWHWYDNSGDEFSLLDEGMNR